MPPRELTLYTFAMSHFCEKVRWTLDLCGLPYQEVPMTPVFHIVPAWRMGGRGKTSLPILKVVARQTTTDFIQDSTRILSWLDREIGPSDLIPRCSLSEEVSAIEDRFDRVGLDVSRIVYAHAFAQGDQFLRFWGSSASHWQRRCLRASLPVIRWAWQRQLDLSPKRMRHAEQRLQQALAWLDGRLSDGRVFLVGSRLTVADVAAASLLAPLACPDEHPVYSQVDFKRYMLPTTAAWFHDRPALRWVRRMYAEHRLALPQGAAATA